jgi:hypothetical protein
VVVVALGAVVAGRVDRDGGQRGIGGALADVGQAVVDAVVVLQVEEAHLELVAAADAPAVVGGEAVLVEAGAGAVVVGQGAWR